MSSSSGIGISTPFAIPYVTPSKSGVGNYINTLAKIGDAIITQTTKQQHAELAQMISMISQAKAAAQNAAIFGARGANMIQQYSPLFGFKGG